VKYRQPKYTIANISAIATGYTGVIKWKRNTEILPSKSGVNRNATGAKAANKRMRL
jgi:hypothetical protein